MQASKIELGRDYATRGFDFRATGLVTVKRRDSTVNYIEGVKIRPLDGDEVVEVKVQAKDIIDTVEERDRLKRLREEKEAATKAEAEAAAAKRRKAGQMLADAIGVPFEDTRSYKDRITGPKVMHSFATIELNNEALDALINYLEGK